MNMWRVKELVDKATNVVMNYSEMEAKVREATSEEPWGPSGQLMSEIAKATFKFEQFPEVMNMLWSRMLKDNKKSWRRVYKVHWTNLLFADVGMPAVTEALPNGCQTHVPMVSWGFVLKAIVKHATWRGSDFATA